MNISDFDKVNEFLADVQFASSHNYEIVTQIRELFFKTKQDLIEDIKYGGLVFFVSGSLVGGVFVYKKHISIEFSNGAEFDDAHSHLDGKGKYRRHLKIVSKEDLVKKEISNFIKQAVNS